MKTGMSIESLAAEIVRQNDEKLDYIVQSDLMEVKAYESGLMLHILDNDLDLVEPLALGPIAHRQIGTSLGIPGRYYERMKYRCPELLAVNCNTWLHEEPENRTLRCLDGVARAFLSDRYRRIDNLEILAAAIPVFGELSSIRFMSCEMTENRMYIKVICPTLHDQIGENALTLQAGIVISNSETGQGAVHVQPLLYVPDWDCGFIVNNEQIRRDHRGQVQSLSDSFHVCPAQKFPETNKEFLLTVQQAIRNAVDENIFCNSVDLMRTAMGLTFQSDHAEDLVNRAGSAYGIKESEKNGVLHHLMEGNIPTLCGLAGAVSRQSSDVVDYDRATELESISYDILTMSSDEWHRLNQDAA